MNFSALQLFQFDNLIQTKANFCFFNLSEENIRSWYGPMEKMHLDRVEIRCQKGDIHLYLQQNKIPADYAILILCPDGKESEEMQKNLESAGFKNVYYVDGGATALRREKSVGKST